MIPSVKVVYGSRGSKEFEKRVNKSLNELHECGYEVIPVSGISDVGSGWACTIFYRR